MAITARTPSGTSCEIVDHVRGPFAQSGAAGGANCDLDLLLDSGTYKLRLASLAYRRDGGRVEGEGRSRGAEEGR